MCSWIRKIQEVFVAWLFDPIFKRNNIYMCVCIYINACTYGVEIYSQYVSSSYLWEVE